MTQAPERIRRAAPWFGLVGVALLVAASVALYPGSGHTVPQSHPDRDFGAYIAR